MMRLLNDAIQECLSLSPVREIHTVSLQEACGTYLAEHLIARLPMPLWDQSAMDGYAVRAKEATQGAVLSVGEIIPAGKWPQRALRSNEAARIFTGAPLPQGADSIVIQENVSPCSSPTQPHCQIIEIDHSAKRGAHIRVRGEELNAGVAFAHPEQVVTPGLLGLCAAQGWTHLTVFKRPKIAILETGTELIQPGAPLSEAQIYATNAVTLSPMIRQSGGDLMVPERVSDEVRQVVHKIHHLIDQGAQILITTGGVSVGDYDPMHEALEQLGATRSFWKVKMKPGKPISVAKLDRPGAEPVLIIGLPGNPVSCVVGYLLFVHPLLQHLNGIAHEHLGLQRVICSLDQAIEKKGSRAELFRVKLKHNVEVKSENRLHCQLTGGQSSAWISSIHEGDGLLYTPAQPVSLMAGDRVEVALFPWSQVWSNTLLFS